MRAPADRTILTGRGTHSLAGFRPGAAKISRPQGTESLAWATPAGARGVGPAARRSLL